LEVHKNLFWIKNTNKRKQMNPLRIFVKMVNKKLSKRCFHYGKS
jgi:hypothetical protein